MLDITFLESCLWLNVSPKFVNFKIPRVIRNVDLSTLKVKIIKQERHKKLKEVQKLQTQKAEQLRILELTVGLLYRISLQILLDRFLRKRRDAWSKKLESKLQRLWIQQRPAAPEALVNQSDHRLNIFEENALRLGLQNPVTPPKVDSTVIAVSFEKLCRAINSNDPTTIDRLRHLKLSYTNAAQSETTRFSNKALHRILRNLRNNDNIKICKFDKGNGIVILNSTDYFRKLDDIVLTDKFIEVPCIDIEHHPILKLEKSLQYFLRINVKSHIDKSVYDVIYPNGTQPGAVGYMGWQRSIKPTHH